MYEAVCLNDIYLEHRFVLRYMLPLFTQPLTQINHKKQIHEIY